MYYMFAHTVYMCVCVYTDTELMRWGFSNLHFSNVRLCRCRWQCVFLVKHEIKLFALHTDPDSDYSEVCQLEHLGCLNEYFITHTQTHAHTHTTQIAKRLRKYFALTFLLSLHECEQFQWNEMRANKFGIAGVCAVDGGGRWRWCSKALGCHTTCIFGIKPTDLVLNSS